MTTKRKIAWEKFTPKQELNSISAEEEQDENASEPEGSWKDDAEEDEDVNEHNAISMINGMDAILFRRKIKTPFGYYDIDDDFSPYNMFDCWVGHTNFRMTTEDFNILDDKIDGIGCLKLLSPYRFFIGIEKMFSFSAVRIQIQKDLCNNLEFDDDLINYSGNVDQAINMVISKINDAIFSIRESEKWAIYIGNDGTIESIKNSDFEYDYEYLEKLKTLKTLKNGNIITYDSL